MFIIVQIGIVIILVLCLYFTYRWVKAKIQDHWENNKNDYKSYYHKTKEFIKKDNNTSMLLDKVFSPEKKTNMLMTSFVNEVFLDKKEDFMVLEKKKLNDQLKENFSLVKNSFLRKEGVTEIKNIIKNAKGCSLDYLYGQKNGLLVQDLDTEKWVYLDLLYLSPTNKRIGFLFQPYYNLFYPNIKHSTEKEFYRDREKELAKLRSLKEYNSIFVIEIPEEIYLLEFDTEKYKWSLSQDKNNKEDYEHNPNVYINEFIKFTFCTPKFQNFCKEETTMRIPKVYHNLVSIE